MARECGPKGANGALPAGGLHAVVPGRAEEEPNPEEEDDLEELEKFLTGDAERDNLTLMALVKNLNNKFKSGKGGKGGKGRGKSQSSSGGGFQGGKPSDEEVTCWGCGKTGHRKMDCPDREADGGKGKGKGKSGGRGGKGYGGKQQQPWTMTDRYSIAPRIPPGRAWALSSCR